MKNRSINLNIVFNLISFLIIKTYNIGYKIISLFCILQFNNKIYSKLFLFGAKLIYINIFTYFWP